MFNKEGSDLLLIYVCTSLKKNGFHNCWYSSTTSEYQTGECQKQI